MAIIQMTLMSKCLERTVPVTVILPADKLTEPGMPPRGDRPYKTLYLLHGYLGSHMDWLANTRIVRFAEDHDLAVVMPSGDNAFYLDLPGGGNDYGEFIGRELVELTRKIFPLSHNREDTFIGGLSMGGFGAVRNGMKYSQTFGRIISLSGALDFGEMLPHLQGKAIGDLSAVLESDMNPEYLVRRGKGLPPVYLACGESDFLLPSNRAFAKFLKEQGVPVVFETAPGGHEWYFWDTFIQKAIAWLPTEAENQGIHSGNIGK